MRKAGDASVVTGGRATAEEARLAALETCELTLRDRPRIQALVARARVRLRRGQPISRDLERAERFARQSASRCEARRAGLPASIEFPAELPVSGEREAVARLIRSHQVVIVCGETGSGKTTQLPKLCLTLGRGVAGLIGHTQPRRIAARSVAARIGEELGDRGLVGHKIRFQDATGPRNVMRVMTDGVLLAEAQGDPDLLGYDTLIIDEAHERSLNIDFLLGYLKRLLPRRPDLKLIVTSATIDPDSFARHFDGAPVIRVGGRTYPVETRYRPLQTEAGRRDTDTAVSEAVEELWRNGPGDVLVFLPGSRQIRDVARTLEKSLSRGAEVLPLYSRLPVAQQNRIFRPSRNGRRVVLATNVAETSITVPGVRYVVDSGDARISRYSHHSGVQQLHIEPVSRASADQRAGRCGRLGPGVCIRLYGEEDYLSRPAFTVPEVRRANLAGVVLQMHYLGLGEIESFPFMDPPERRYVNDGYRLLEVLGAMDRDRALTARGKELAALPLDPRVGRIALEARHSPYRAPVLVLAAALSVQDPREQRPGGEGEPEEPLWRHARSDFLGLCQTWRHYRTWLAEHSRSRAHKLCEQHGLAYVRMREWEAVYQQICELLQVPADGDLQDLDAGYAAIHQCLLAGLIDHIGLRGESFEYQGPRGRRFHIFPGSGLFKKPPPWVMSAELVKTSRVFARTNARVEPKWIEHAGAHLVQREYVEPRWDKTGARVVASERVSLFGLPLLTRNVHYGPLAPVASRELFIRHALMAGEYRHRGAFYAHNLGLIDDIRTLEAKTRRPDLLAHDDEIFAFYDRRLPNDVYNGRAFEAWRRRAEREQPRLLFMRREDVLRDENLSAGQGLFPDELEVHGRRLRLHYALDPGSVHDGVTADVPVAALRQLPAAPFEWLVPGLRREKIEALIRSLPKRLRRHFFPAPEFARACDEALAGAEGPLCMRLAERLRAMTGVEVEAGDFAPERLPDHLHMNFRVLAGDGSVLGEGTDLAALQRDLAHEVRERFDRVDTSAWEHSDLTGWNFQDLPERISVGDPRELLYGYPALAQGKGARVDLRIFDNPEGAARAHRAGLRQLFLNSLPEQTRYVHKRLRKARELALRYAALGGEALEDEILATAAEHAFSSEAGGPIRTRAAFETRREAACAELVAVAERLASEADDLLRRQADIRARLERDGLPEESRADMTDQLAALIYPGFIRSTPAAAWARLPVYLQGITLRLERLGNRPQRDIELTREIRSLVDAYRARVQREPALAGQPAMRDFRWQLEELRISLFAQDLKARGQTSVPRLQRKWHEDLSANERN